MKRIILLLGFWGYVFSAPIELCASFECDNCYSIRIQKADSLEKKEWLFKDTVQCECGMWLRPSFKVKNLPGDSWSGGGGTCLPIGRGLAKMMIPEGPQMNIQKGEIVYTAYVDNSREKIFPKFKQDVELYWETKFVCQGNPSNDKKLSQKISAILVGECGK